MKGEGTTAKPSEEECLIFRKENHLLPISGRKTLRFTPEKSEGSKRSFESQLSEEKDVPRGTKKREHPEKRKSALGSLGKEGRHSRSFAEGIG